MDDKFSIGILSSASGGGAGIAAKRICDSFNTEPGISAHFIDIASMRDRAPVEVYEDGVVLGKFTNTHFTGEYSGFVRGWLIDYLSTFDAINVHWASYLVTTSELLALAERGKKIVITMHDFFYSTGGCHYQAGCSGQKVSCNVCPQVNADKFSFDSVRQAFTEKKLLLSHPNVQICAPSAFVSSTVSGLGLISPERAHTIRNIYHSPNELALSKKSPTRDIMMIADSLEEKRKGARLAVEALALASSQSDTPLRIHFVGNASDDLIQLCKTRGLDAIFHGRISDHNELVKIYEIASVLLTCSYEDNWPNVLVEGGAHGVVPVVGSGHGCEEFCNQYNIGKVVEEYTREAFARALIDLLLSFPSQERIETFARTVRRDHSSAEIGNQYLSVLLPEQYRSTTRSNKAFQPTLPSIVSENYLKSAGVNQAGTHSLIKRKGPFSEVSRSFAGYGLPVYDVS